MKIAQKIKTIPAMFLLWALPMAMLLHVTAKPRATTPPEPNHTAQPELSAAENYGKLPLHFEPNLGQSAKQVKFLSRGQGYTLFLTPNEAVFSLRNSERDPSVLRMKLAGADANAELDGKEGMQGQVTHLSGKGRNEW